jgi:epoxyqueuosine reductase
MNTAPAENTILLHACCGPCSITSVLRLREMGLAPTLYFYNPNIHPLSEYLRRREGLLIVAERCGVPVILPDQDDEAAAFPGLWLERIAVLGSAMADMARRCPQCYDIRLERTACMARTLGFARYSSTLLYSKYQNHQAILDAGEHHAGNGLEFVGEDFRPGWHEGIRLSKEWGVYRQQYCGCVLSEFDRYQSKIGM